MADVAAVRVITNYHSGNKKNPMPHALSKRISSLCTTFEADLYVTTVGAECMTKGAAEIFM
jgi:hypothetical protein